MTAKKEFPAKRGRKPKAPGERFLPLTVRTTAAERKQLEDIAELNGESLSSAMQRMIRRAYAEMTPRHFAALEGIRKLRAEVRS